MPRFYFSRNPAALDFLKNEYAILGVDRFTNEFEKRFGYRLTRSALNNAVNYYQVEKKYAPPGYYSVDEVCMFSGASVNALKLMLSKGRFKCKIVNRKRFVPESEIDKIIRFYRRSESPPWPAMTATEAAKVLCCWPGGLTRAAKLGLIEGVQIRGKWHLRKSDIQWGYNQLAAGAIRVPWEMLRREECPEAPWPAYTVEKAVQVMGLKSLDTIRASIRIKALPSFKKGKRLYVPKEAIDLAAKIRKETGERPKWRKVFRMLTVK